MSKPTLPVLPESLLARMPRLSGICPPSAILLLFLVGPLVSFGLGKLAHMVGPLATKLAMALWVGADIIFARRLYGSLLSAAIPFVILLILFIVYPGILGMLPGHLSVFVFKTCHCRNRTIVSLACVLNGAVFYAAHAWSAWQAYGGLHPFIFTPDQLHDSFSVIGIPVTPLLGAIYNPTLASTPWWMVVLVVIESMLVVTVSALCALSIEDSHYCEIHHCWYGECKQAEVPLGSAEAIATALQTGDVRGLDTVAQFGVMIGPSLQIRTRSCPKGPDCDVWIHCQVQWPETTLDAKGNTSTSIKSDYYFRIMMPASFGNGFKKAFRLQEEPPKEKQSIAEAGSANARIDESPSAGPAWVAPPVAIIAADAVRKEFIEAGAVCWFCQKGKPADGKPHNVVVFKKEGDARIDKTVWVPRCSTCEVFHKRHSPLPEAVNAIALLTFIGLCVLIGVLGAKPLGFWAWVIGVVVAFIGFGAVALTIESIFQRRAAGMRVAALAESEYPEAQELVKQGWQVDTSKTGSAQ
jgi:hypothetical protein